MALCNFKIYLLIIIWSAISLGYEYCPNRSTLCPHYCCRQMDYFFCCNDCRLSYIYHPRCYIYRRYWSYPMISGIIIASIAFVLILFLIISLSCGYCSSNEKEIDQREYTIYPAPMHTTDGHIIQSQYQGVYPQNYPPDYSYQYATAPAYHPYAGPTDPYHREYMHNPK